MSLVDNLFLSISIFMGVILCLRAPIPLVMFGNKGETIFLRDHHIREVIPTLLINIWGGNMVLMV